MDEIPYSYIDSNLYSGFANPSAVTVQNTQLTAYFRRYLLQKAMAVAKWTLPENWSKRYFLYALHVMGNVAIINTDKYGVIPQHCTLSGRTVQYQPANVLISNPLIKNNMRLTIGENCTLFSMTTDYGGIIDLVNYYAGLMALVSESFATNTLNSKLAYMMAAGSKTFAESMKKAADEILSGQPYVVMDKNLFGPDGKPNVQLFTQNLQQNFIAPAQMELLQMIENHFDKELGLPASYSMKKERTITKEAEDSAQESAARYGMWMDGWKESARHAKEMFGVDISVDWRIAPGGVEDV